MFSPLNSIQIKIRIFFVNVLDCKSARKYYSNINCLIKRMYLPLMGKLHKVYMLITQRPIIYNFLGGILLILIIG